MREIKVRYTFKHVFTGNIEKKVYTLSQLEEKNAWELSPCFNVGFGYKLIARDEYTGEKDVYGENIYENDIVYQEFHDRISEKHGFTGVVKQREGSWLICNGLDQAESLWSEVNMNHVKGNIHENLEAEESSTK